MRRGETENPQQFLMLVADQGMLQLKAEEGAAPSYIEKKIIHDYFFVKKKTPSEILTCTSIVLNNDSKN